MSLLSPLSSSSLLELDLAFCIIMYRYRPSSCSSPILFLYQSKHSSMKALMISRPSSLEDLKAKVIVFLRTDLFSSPLSSSDVVFMNSRPSFNFTQTECLGVVLMA